MDSVEDTVTRLTMRGLVELDDYERKVLVKDLTVRSARAPGHGGLTCPARRRRQRTPPLVWTCSTTGNNLNLV
ncbi:hypothetical protein SVIOM342S_06306 [Streptomyces violaceorubidus]